MLSKEKIEIYKNRLEQERTRLLNTIKELNIPEDFGSDVDPDEETDESEEFVNRTAKLQGIKTRINQIDLALDDIENNTYGICKRCGGEISEETLDADPETRLCKKCKLEENKQPDK